MARRFGATSRDAAPAPDNDNAIPGGIRDTTHLLARPEVVHYLRATLRRYGIASQDMADAIGEVQVEAIEAARTKRMPAGVAQWKALAGHIAVRWAIDRLREADVRVKYDAGLCDDPDAGPRPTVHWEQRDPVDTKRYLAVLKELFDSGQMPEYGAEILWGEADEVPHADIAAEIGVSETVVDNRLSRMRATFYRRLAVLGLLTLLVLLAVVLRLRSRPGEDSVATPPPAVVRPVTPEIAPPPTMDAGRDGTVSHPLPQIRRRPSEEIEPFPVK